MGIFNKGEEKIWEKINELQELIDKKTPEMEKDARQASKKASEYRNRAKETKEEADKILIEVKEQSAKISKRKDELEDLLSDANLLYQQMEKEQEEVIVLKDSVIKKSEAVEVKIKSINTILEEHPDLEDEVHTLGESLGAVEENSNKISAVVKNVVGRKSEIDKIYFDVVGYTEEDEETGEDVHINGLKDDLENQYNELQSNLESLDESIDTLEEGTKDKFNNLFENANHKTEEFQSQWKLKYEKLEEKIQGLLPNALTAGLSSAFSEKKDEEVKSLDKHKTQFGWGIAGLVFVSLIPFVVSVIFQFSGDTWDQIIQRIPRLVIAIIPLYLPVLWLAYSANKKMNLSKRLIEEYSHKEVLSKTFEGLSTQIKDLENENISSELKVKLLYNFLQVSSENPGKLISDYETSDHPLMDVLEKSYKLETAVEKLQKIPGMGKMAKILDKKSNQILHENSEKIADGLAIVEDDIKENGQEKA